MHLLNAQKVRKTHRLWVLRAYATFRFGKEYNSSRKSCGFQTEIPSVPQRSSAYPTPSQPECRMIKTSTNSTVCKPPA